MNPFTIAWVVATSAANRLVFGGSSGSGCMLSRCIIWIFCIMCSSFRRLGTPGAKACSHGDSFTISSNGNQRWPTTDDYEEPLPVDRCLTVLAVVLKPLGHTDWHIIKCNQLPKSTSHLLDLAPNWIPTITMFYILVFFSKWGTKHAWTFCRD